MYTLLVVLAVVTAVLLTFVVLIQESKGGGLASNFASSNQIMGVRKTTDVVEKATWFLAALLVVLSVCSAYCLDNGSSNSSIVNSVTTETAAPATAAPATAQPAAPAAPAAAQPAK